MAGDIGFVSFYLLIYLFIFLPETGITIAIICLLLYSSLSVMKISVWHSTALNIDQWCTRHKTCTMCRRQSS